MSSSGTSKSRRQLIVLGSLVAVLGLLGAYRLLRPGTEPGERSYWYDLSEKRFYAGPKELVPPQAGVGGASDDAYPATVISWSKDRREKEVAFLISYTDELRALQQQALELKAQGMPPPDKLGDRLWVTANTLVRSPDGEQWHPKSSPAGQKIIAVLTMRGAGGEFPFVCSPDD